MKKRKSYFRYMKKNASIRIVRARIEINPTVAALILYWYIIVTVSIHVGE